MKLSKTNAKNNQYYILFLFLAIVFMGSVNAASPTTQLLSPNGGEIWKGTQAILWEATDADGDNLSISLEYRTSQNATWTPITEAPIENTGSYELNTELLEDGNYFIKVIASDGENSSEDISNGLFTISSRFPYPLAINKTVNTSINEPIDITLEAEDENGTVLTECGDFCYALFYRPDTNWTKIALNGTISGNTATVTYTPDEGFEGIDYFIFRGTFDGQVDPGENEHEIWGSEGIITINVGNFTLPEDNNQTNNETDTNETEEDTNESNQVEEKIEMNFTIDSTNTSSTNIVVPENAIATLIITGVNSMAGNSSENESNWTEVSLSGSVEVNSSTEIGNILISVPSGIKIIGNENWTGNVLLPQIKSSSPLIVASQGNVIDSATVVVVGHDTRLEFDKAIRVFIPGQAGKHLGYISEGVFAKITETCEEDSQAYADANISENGECFIESDGDLVIWTKHFTEFVAYTEKSAPQQQSSSSSSSSSSGRSSSGGYFVSKALTNSSAESNDETEEINLEDSNEETVGSDEEIQGTGFFREITGAVTGVVERPVGKAFAVVFLILIVVGIVMLAKSSRDY